MDVPNDPHLGDANNLGIWGLAVFNDALYIGVTNRTTGFEIWRADGANCNRPPGLCALSWEKIIDDGGGLPVPEDPAISNNARIFEFNEFNGYLYFGAAETASPNSARPSWAGSAPMAAGTSSSARPRDASTMAAIPQF